MSTLPTGNPNRVIRSINVDPAVWAEAQAVARGQDTNMSRVIRNALEAYSRGI